MLRDTLSWLHFSSIQNRGLRSLFWLSCFVIGGLTTATAQEYPVPLTDPAALGWGAPGSARVQPPEYIGNEAPVSLLPYYAHLFYGERSIKQGGDIFGIHTLLDFKFDTLEVDVGKTDIEFKDGFRLQQYDFTGVYTSYWIPNIGLKFGGHGITSNSDISNAFVLITGVQFFETAKWDISADVYVSRYDRATIPVTVIQGTPKVGIYWSKSDEMTIRSELIGYGIGYSQDIGLGNKGAYSVEARHSMDYGPWGLTAYGWGGRQAFAVRNGGFLVFNLPEERVGGYGGELRYSFTKNSKLMGRIGNEHLRDSVTRGLTNQLVLTALFSYTF